MAIKAQVKKMNVPIGRDDAREYYVSKVVRSGVIDTDKMAKFVAQDCGAREAQVKIIIGCLLESMVQWLEEGHGVRLDRLGTFLPSIKSDSSPVADEVGVRFPRVSFYPCRELSKRMKEVSYNMENAYATKKSESEGEAQPPTGDENDGPDII